MRYTVFFSYFLVFFLSSLACASYIQMTVTPEPSPLIEEKTFNLNFTILNSGDEPAHSVQVSLQLPAGFQSEPVFKPKLMPDTPFKHSFKVVVNEDIAPGTYPVVVKTNYADANAYPFSTVSPMFINYRKPTPFRLRGKINELTLEGEETKDLQLEVSNMDESGHKVLIRLHLPNEIAAESYSKSVDVKPKQISKIRFPVKSFGALPGSTYFVFATMEYDENGMHYGATAAGKVNIVAGTSYGLPSWMPFAVLCLLALALLYYQMRR